jgi:hypothetical protein
METGVASWTECYKKWRVFSTAFAPILIEAPAVKSHRRSGTKPSQKPSDQRLANPTVKSAVKQE